ncbi:MAG: VacJ family lipoprotein [Hyphomonadaceae bacterium]|nr:VacJ family lipoprotein [Hyphomonadaceae bacterium]
MRGLVSILALTVCLAAPSIAFAQEAATSDVAPVQTQASNDPWEGFNRNLFGIHQTVDHAVLGPVARGYRAVTPRPLRSGVVNFLRNLKAPVVLANDLLQGEVNRAGSTAGRFAINTTIGIGGVFDPATSMGLEHHDEDFGQTLAVWGVPSGPYIFVPLMGPTTVRDGAGQIIDVAFDPLTWAEFDDVNTARAARTVISGVAQRELLIEQIDSIDAQGGDTYVAYRSAYEVSREAAIQNGRADVQDLPDFNDIDETPVTDTPNGSAEAIQPQADQIQGAENSVAYTEASTLPTSLPD